MTRRVVGIALAVALASGCAASGRADTSRTTTLTVLAASSLSDAFADVAKAYEDRHHGTRVALSFAGSQTLVAQVREGVHADVLATADERTMATARAELAGDPVVFAHNRLVIAVPRGNPDGIRGLRDLARPGLVVVLADPAVPAGHYARAALDAARVTVRPRSLEDNVRAVLTKVRLGEADAGVVYASDVAAAHGAVVAVDVPEAPPAAYPVAALAGGRQQEASAFIAFVQSEQGRTILRRAGFEAP